MFVRVLIFALVKSSRGNVLENRSNFIFHLNYFLRPLVILRLEFNTLGVGVLFLAPLFKL